MAEILIRPPKSCFFLLASTRPCLVATLLTDKNCIAQAVSFVSLVVLWISSYYGGERLGNYIWIEKGAYVNSLTKSVINLKKWKEKPNILYIVRWVA